MVRQELAQEAPVQPHHAMGEGSSRRAQRASRHRHYHPPQQRVVRLYSSQGPAEFGVLMNCLSQQLPGRHQIEGLSLPGLSVAARRYSQHPQW